jgi:hypothetical protein
MAKRIIHHQKRIPGGRKALPSCVLPKTHSYVDFIARKYGVSRSWVIATILSEALGVREQESYKTVDSVKLRRVK